MKSTWNLQEGVKLCKKIEPIAEKHGCHIGLTGGVLYKEGERKDLDIVVYRIRKYEKIHISGLFDELMTIGIIAGDGYGFIWKATYVDTESQSLTKYIDFLFPEDEGVYDQNS